MTSVNTPWRWSAPEVLGHQQARERGQQQARGKPNDQPAGRKVIQRSSDCAQRQDHAGKYRKAQGIGTNQHRHLSAAAGDTAEALVVKNERREHRRDQRRSLEIAPEGGGEAKGCQPADVEEGAEGGGEEEADEIEQQEQLAGHRNHVITQAGFGGLRVDAGQGFNERIYLAFIGQIHVALGAWMLDGLMEQKIGFDGLGVCS